MIKLKNGSEIEYQKEFDLFFQNLLEAIINVSQKAAQENFGKGRSEIALNDLFLKELMDNCIYVTHQLFEIAKTNEDLSKFMVTGFLFNSIVISLTQAQGSSEKEGDSRKDVIH